MEAFLNTLLALLLISLCYLAFLVIVAVPLIKKTQWVSNQFEILPLLDDQEVEVQDWLQSQHTAIEACGFTWIGNYQIKNHSPQVISYFSFFRHPQDGLAAMAICIKSSVMSIHYLEVSQAFQNQHGLTVNNSQIAGSWKQPNKEILRFPWLTEFAQIYRVQQKLREQKPYSFQGLYVAVDKEIEFLHQFMLAENQFIVKIGLFQLNADQSKCIPTWSGALKMVLKNTFPGKELRHFLEERHNRKLADS